jgi:hypothetical protein
VFNQYCTYLESIYPRRCCDDDNNNQITYEYPAPKINLDPNTYCPICTILYTTMNNSQNSDKHLEYSTETTTLIVDGIKEKIKELQETNTNTKKNIKISSKIIGRSLKPIQGMFYNIAKYNKLFRRTCDTLGQNLFIRNCGPGFIIRYSLLLCIPPTILEKEFT